MLDSRRAILSDAAHIGEHLRACDRMEVEAQAGRDCYIPAVIGLSILASGALCWTATRDKRPVFVIGCAYDPQSDTAAPWLLATDEVVRYPGALTRLTRRYVDRMLESYPRLLNYVDERNVNSVRWLERIGFAVHEPIAMGVQGERFHPFTMGA